MTPVQCCTVQLASKMLLIHKAFKKSVIDRTKTKVLKYTPLKRFHSLFKSNQNNACKKELTYKRILKNYFNFYHLNLASKYYKKYLKVVYKKVLLYITCFSYTQLYEIECSIYRSLTFKILSLKKALMIPLGETALA